MNAMQKTTQAEACATKDTNTHERDTTHRAGFREAISQEPMKNAG